MLRREVMNLYYQNLMRNLNEAVERTEEEGFTGDTLKEFDDNFALLCKEIVKNTLCLFDVDLIKFLVKDSPKSIWRELTDIEHFKMSFAYDALNLCLSKFSTLPEVLDKTEEIYDSIESALNQIGYDLIQVKMVPK